MERGPGHGRPGGLGAVDPAARAAPAAPRCTNPAAPSALLDHRARPPPVRGDRPADHRPSLSRNLRRAGVRCGGGLASQAVHAAKSLARAAARWCAPRAVPGRGKVVLQRSKCSNHTGDELLAHLAEDPGRVEDVLVVGSDIAMDDLGTRSLKGVDGAWQLFAARPTTT